MDQASLEKTLIAAGLLSCVQVCVELLVFCGAGSCNAGVISAKRLLACIRCTSPCAVLLMAAPAQALAHWREAAADLRAALALDPGDAELTAALAAVEADAAEAHAEARVARRVQEAGEPGAAGWLETHNSPGTDVQDADTEPVPACGAPGAAGGAEEATPGSAARAAPQAAGEAAHAAAANPAGRTAAPDAREPPPQQAPDVAALHRVAALVQTMQGLAGRPGCPLAWFIVHAL